MWRSFLEQWFKYLGEDKAIRVGMAVGGPPWARAANATREGAVQAAGPPPPDRKHFVTCSVPEPHRE
jgi:hypothetical protein